MSDKSKDVFNDAIYDSGAFKALLTCTVNDKSRRKRKRRTLLASGEGVVRRNLMVSQGNDVNDAHQFQEECGIKIGAGLLGCIKEPSAEVRQSVPEEE
ncbi:WSSV286 [White spot syndrome virus]|uniref:WSSV286 n=1 Tax=White spot syndrome virus TaxID=342409 RepID=A0A2I6SBZ5_9VIRU|nr:WSSV286 [White spot syndrome virus]